LAASIFEKQGRIDDAIASYDKALANAPKDTQVLNARALVHLFHGNPDKAVADLLKIQALEGSNFVNSFNLGLAYGQLDGKWKDTFQHFEKAFKKNPDLLKGYFESAGEYETTRLRNVLDTIMSNVSSVDASEPGAFYRNELTTLLTRKMASI
jgi:tetratricopeptide (TPR) repeat protein